MSYDSKLLIDIAEKNPNIDITKIKEAYAFAKESHENQTRKSGEKYIAHPIEVARILVDMKMDTDTIIAGILHDIVEDTNIPTAELIYNFGEDVANLVEGVTKITHLPQNAQNQNQNENLRKVIVSMAKDVRVIIIKLADRIHNMRTLNYLPLEKQRKIAEETLRIYAPIAHRLGMAKIKGELEDLAIRYLQPEKYKKIAILLAEKRETREKYTDFIMVELKKELLKYNVEAEITGRPKHIYSIYKKMYEKSKKFHEIYDLNAIRVVVDNKQRCYNVLGIIHNLWKPIIGRLKDYIAMPKANGYRSIHTTVLGPKAEFIEIQIRTNKMHQIAEEGIAAHWMYKENIKNIKSQDSIYKWLKKILDWQNEGDESKEFVDRVTGDNLTEEVFVFTPQGDVVELPAGATPLDFAFFIHTEVGYKCNGAKVNGRIVPLGYKLQSGEKVEIITSKSQTGPGKEWLKLVVTSGAKNKIKRWFREKEYEERVHEGRIILEKELSYLNIREKDFEKREELDKILRKFNFHSYKELLFSLGIGKINAAQVTSKLHFKEKTDENLKEQEEEFIQENIKTKVKKQAKKNDMGVVIPGIDNVELRFAQCCSPVFGDDIAGYITRGNGIAIHKINCQNFLALKEKHTDRIINGLSWDEDLRGRNDYTVKTIVVVQDTPGVLMEVLKTISDMKINLGRVNSDSYEESGLKLANLYINMQVKDINQFEKLKKKLNKLKIVHNVYRNNDGREDVNNLYYRNQRQNG